MSICRFVTDDWNSDVHVYQTGNGINIETAGFRLRFTPNHPYPHGDMTRLTLDGHPHEAARLAYEQAEACRHAVREPIQDRHAGHTWTGLSPLAALGVLTGLRSRGFRVPEQAVDRLKEAGERVPVKTV